MSRRYLFGPVSGAFAECNLRRQRQAGDCRTFGPGGGVDVTIGAADSWETACAGLPAGWQPDYLVLNLSDAAIPHRLWDAPVPIVGLAGAEGLLWHAYRHLLPGCELILTDPAGADGLRRAGLAQARVVPFLGCARAAPAEAAAEPSRDIDLLFLGDVHPATSRRGLPWLMRLARLGERWRVVVQASGSVEADRAWLARARIVFHHSLRSECGRTVFEAVDAGALLFVEADNPAVSACLRDRREYVAYTEEDLEALLEHYLEHEDERCTVAQGARDRLQGYRLSGQGVETGTAPSNAEGQSPFPPPARTAAGRFEDLWQELIESEWPGMAARSSQRPPRSELASLRARTWQALGAQPPVDRALAADLGAALADRPFAAELHNALGLVETLSRRGDGPTTAPLAEMAAGYFQRALTTDPTFMVAALNLVEALVGIEQTAAAVDHARRTLTLLDRAHDLGEADREAGLFPPGMHHLRVEWERAAWDNAGRPDAEGRAKRELLRWRLHTLLADLTGDLTHYYEAALVRPDLPITRAALGCALGRAGRFAQAVEHLHRAVAENPLDVAAARALYQSLEAGGDRLGQRRLARDRRLLAQAAPQLVTAEAWFAEAAPVGDELASILILCCNELPFTRRCLESVLRHTRAPYELVIVDNGSTDGTPAYLEEIQSRPGPVRVRVLRNECNRGFPAGCNQALAAARGSYLVFLNNDTVVTAGWLDGLTGWLQHDWPQVGLVGAVTNYARPPQQIAVDYHDDLGGMEAFAARRQREFLGQALQVERLTGFCLLARREVLERVGGFDEQYGLGFFDDDDLCVRVRAAGFQLLLALNVFIHHYGSRTFSHLRVDCSRQLQANFARFKDKWGPEHAAGYRLPPALAALAEPTGLPVDRSCAPASEAVSVRPTVVVEPAPAAVRPRVSLCLMVKNEEANLPACLQSVTGLVDEIVVVDTGSTDGTRDVASRFQARVVDFPWVDSFAAARNEGLRHASGDWVFWMDADDRLDADNRTRLRALLTDLPRENVAFVMKCLCLPDPTTGTATAVDHVRLFRRHPELRWQYRVHEQILHSVRRLGGTVRWSDVVIHHVGYQDLALRRRKLDRDLRLLLLEDTEHPDDPFTLFNLGSIYQEVGRPADALPLFRRSLERSEPSDSIVRKLYALIVQCQRQLSQTAEALATCQAGRRHYPEDAELLFQEGLARRERGDQPGAEACWLQVLGTREGAHFTSVDTGLSGYKTRHNLAVLYHEQGRIAEAEAQWRAALAEQADFLPAWLGLAEVYLAQGRWTDLEQVGAALASKAQGTVEAEMVRARGHLARREFREARQLLEALIPQHPQSLRLHLILSHVYLQEGQDWGAAERVLRDVLMLDPTQEEARRNLAVLLQQSGIS